MQWNDNSPIYRQIKDKVVALILEGGLKVDEALPSVRQVAAQYQVNPLTVARAYQELVEEGLVEKRRGVGMFVSSGAPERLLRREREAFLTLEWPLVLERIHRLALSVSELFKGEELK